ncbi:MAG: SDR family NAD(P)-dependent oxidoreductase, partial [Rhizobiaceae bacterium]
MGNNLFNLDGRLALVTGSSRGIGHVLARGLAGHGARLVVNGRDAARAEQTAEDLRSTGFDAHAAPFDVIDSAAVEEAVAR